MSGVPIRATAYYWSGLPRESRILIRIIITSDTDFGQLVFLEGQSHSGLIRLPDVSSNERVVIIKDLIERFQKELESHAIITVRGGKIRISASSE